MKSILLIILFIVVCISGCFAQEKGIFICDYMQFDSTATTKAGRILIEVSPTKNQVEFNYGTAKTQTFYLERVVKIEGEDCTIKGGDTNMNQITLYYTKGLLVGGLIEKHVFKEGRYKDVRIEFTRQTLTSK